MKLAEFDFRTLHVPQMDETTLLIDVDSENNCGFERDDGWDETLAEINLNIGDHVKVPVSSSGGHVYNYNGVEIRFPYPAYRSQQLMMEKMIEGLKAGENCLLESPTGTGKTAALLCALLAWQNDCHMKNDNCADIIKKAAEKLGECSCGLTIDKERTRVIMSLDKTTYDWVLTSETPYEEEECPKPDSYMSVHEQPTQELSASVPDLPTATDGSSPPKRQKMSGVHIVTRNIKDVCGYCKKRNVYDRSNPPKIYYCTRTHSQMVQVVKQLKDTAYRGSKMTILASRIATCISEKATKEIQKRNSEAQHRSHRVDINDICREWRKNSYLNQKFSEKEKDKVEEVIEHEEEKKEDKDEKNGTLKKDEEEKLPVCEYFAPNKDNESGEPFSRIQDAGAWDFEDIKQEGRDCGACPYYGSYALHSNASIVFGSYNFLIDPSLREFKKIKYINSVIVFDEAHNIEDICRSSFSFTLDVEKFKDEVLGLVTYLLWKDRKEFELHVSVEKLSALKELNQRFEKWLTWLIERGLKIKQARVKEDVKESFENEKLFDALKEMDMDLKGIDDCIKLASKADGSAPPVKGESQPEDDYYIERATKIKRKFILSPRVGEFLKKMRQTLEYLCDERDGVGGAKDFKGYLTRTFLNETGSRRHSNRNPEVTMYDPTKPDFNFVFDVICLNPAVGFRELRNTAFSIIVASGTLTPLKSFSSELATPFAITLQADHVIPSSSVWAGVISVGPKKLPMCLTKMNQDNLEIQDEIGDIICEICCSVPNGVLVFLPSYGLMKKLKARWTSYPTSSPVMKRIERKKKVFYEESYDKNAFKRQMEQYKELVKGGIGFDGCVLFAVFRGKISEGIDFADEQARSVVTIGIPFSNLVAAEIVAKREYNDMRGKQPGESILSGSEWYKIQAYRAMNQGFGRCVRHQSDWGAVVMIESRLGERRNHPYLSGWVTKNLKVYDDFEEAKRKLDLFIRARKGQARFRRSVKIEYEPNEIPAKEESTQILDFHDLPTQRIELSPPVATSSPIHQPTNIGESSPEYSFTEDIESVMGSQSQEQMFEVVNQVEERSIRDDDASNSSMSVYGESPVASPNPRFSKSNRIQGECNIQLSVNADRIQVNVDSGNTSPRALSNAPIPEASDASTLDVSMPSVYDLSQASMASSVSYHSDLEM